MMTEFFTLMISGKRHKVFWAILLVLISFHAFGQSCNCPAQNECGACQDGIAKLSLRMTGVASATSVTISDAQGVVFDAVVNPNAVFTFESTRPSGKFTGNQLTVDLGGVFNVNIPINCNLPVYIQSVYGNFTITDGFSKTGGKLCCAPGQVDNTPPIFSNCPSDIIVSANTNSCNAIVDWVAPLAADNCEVKSVNATQHPGSIFSIGTTAITYTATDKAGNTSTCSFNVIVKDETSPVLAGTFADINSVISNSCSVRVFWTDPVFTDCSQLSVTSTYRPGDFFNVGDTEVKYIASDQFGNTATYKFHVMVTDNAGPTFSGCLSDITVPADANCSARVQWVAPSVADACDVASVSASHQPGSTFPIGTTEVKYTAKDVFGNASFCTFKVIVKNENLPVITTCPDDIFIEIEEGESASAEWAPPTASARCSEVQVTSSHNPGDVFNLGTTEVSYTATNDAGNTSTCNFKVTVFRKQIDFQINAAITPDGDGINDTWIMPNIENFINNSVLIVDRWGGKIFSASGYNNADVVWRGTNSSGALLPTGTYFYVISVRSGNSSVEKRGFVELIR